MGYCDMDITICSHNTGVIGAFTNGRSYNVAWNICICRIMSSLIPSCLTISPIYVTSAYNLMDHLLRGLENNYASRLECSFQLTIMLSAWLVPL